jgi:hypothetical protein
MENFEKILGVWEEYRLNGKSIKNEINLKQDNNETKADSRIVNYLNNGIPFERMRTQVRCIFNDEIIGVPETYCDGEWIWTTEFIFYVKNYNLKLPTPFYNKIKERNFETMKDEEIDEVKFNQAIRNYDLY